MYGVSSSAQRVVLVGVSSTTISDNYARLLLVKFPRMPVYEGMPFLHLFRVYRGRARKYSNVQNVPLRQFFY